MVLYNSLLKHCPDFHLYVFAFDDACHSYLVSQNLPHLTVVSLKDFEDERLLEVKPGRTAAEYCWTCTASTIYYSITTFGLHNCTYIDADMQFYADPRILLDEMKGASVLITSHRYTAKYDQSVESGKYCVQFVAFLNDERGMKVLKWWRDACIEWCYARVEDGKFGDQKYLDEWPLRFEGVHELQHLGGGIAPWNVQQYEFVSKGDTISGMEISTGKKFQVVFFHFHGLKLFKNDIVLLTGDLYDLSENVKTTFYRPYVKALLAAGKRIAETAPGLSPHGANTPSPAGPMTFRLMLRYYLYDLKRSVKNVFGQNLAKRLKHHFYYRTEDFNS
jgi:hypothetical protein